MTAIDRINRTRITRTGVMAGLLLTLTGCALSGEQEFHDVQSTIRERTGHTVLWTREASAREAADDRIRELLARELTVDDAVEIALLNNRLLQAEYENLGLARADVVQATLLPNPVFEGSYMGTINDRSDPSVEITVVENIVELLTIPQRRKIAKNLAASTKAEVSRQILSLASEVRAQFYAVQSDEQMLEMLRQVVQSTRGSLEASRRLREAGNITRLELAQQEAQHSRAKLNLQRAQLMALKERERLHILMGLWGEQVDLKIPPRLPEIPEERVDVANIEQRAVEAAFVLEELRKRIDAEGQALGLTRATALIPELELGASFAREDDGNRLLGPLLSLPIPLFDQGQARLRRSHARLNQLLATYHQKAVEVRSVARTARDHLELARERARYAKQVDLPLADEIVQQSQLQYNGMQIGVFQLLQAKQNQIDAGRRYVEDMREYWLAHTELQAILQGHITEFGMQITALDEVPGSPLH